MPFVRSYVNVIIVGNVARDPELRYTPKNTPVTLLVVATNRAFVTSSGERKEETQFHRVSVWGAFGEKIANIVKKGDKLYIEGRLEYRERRDEEGKLTCREVVIRAEKIIILQRKRRPVVSEGEENTTEVDIDAIAESISAEANEEQPAEEATKPAKKEGEGEEDLPF